MAPNKYIFACIFLLLNGSIRLYAQQHLNIIMLENGALIKSATVGDVLLILPTSRDTISTSFTVGDLSLTEEGFSLMKNYPDDSLICFYFTHYRHTNLHKRTHSSKNRHSLSLPSKYFKQTYLVIDIVYTSSPKLSKPDYYYNYYCPIGGAIIPGSFKVNVSNP